SPLSATGVLGGASPARPLGAPQRAAPKPSGAIAYGYDIDDAYSSPAGLNLSGPITVAHVTLTPKTATDLDGTPATVLATVTDTQNNPVRGVTVNFQVAGANTASGSGLTDANRHARCPHTAT